ncbi:hypothetical protein AAG570_005956 [Ranatra chinensis]|uniref:Chitin-binding type-2 domain-containing protein n=1 Tax=Ranatra chinensis TaxID=642074 RepID=A0ABD0XWM6_9HEMI
MASKRRNMFHKNKTQETTEEGVERDQYQTAEMRGAVFFVLCAIFVSVAVGQRSNSIAYLLNLASSPFSSAKQCSQAPDGAVKICSNETTAEVCFNQVSVLVEFCTGSKPFCVQGECAPSPAGTFICPAASGYFPSLDSCNSFYICSGFVPYLYECLDKSVYDHELKTCVKQSSSKPCNRFNCAGKHLKYAAYPGDRAFYALCVNSKPVAVGVCTKKNKGMDEVSQNCETYCNKEGNIADDSDCKGYHECLLQSGSRYKITQRKCPPGMIFNSLLAVCESGTC